MIPTLTRSSPFSRELANPAAGWLHRQTLITYCQQTVDASLAAKRAATAGVEDKLAAPPPRKAGVMGGVHERGIGEETVIVEQIANEASIEAIVRKRTLEGESSSLRTWESGSSRGGLPRELTPHVGF